MATMTNDAPAVQLMGLIAQGVTVHLYTNNHVPSRSDRPRNFTEPNDRQYRPRPIAPGAWTVTGTVAKSPEQHFQFTEWVGPVVGYFLTVGDWVIASERIFDAAGMVRQVRRPDKGFWEEIVITVELRITP